MRFSRLFLHMGPGLNAFPEQEVLSIQQPHTYFWTQPLISSPSDAFAQLVDAACLKVDECFHLSGQPIELIAHSFGGHIATEIIKRIPEKISKCEFFSTGYDIPAGFFNLLKNMRDLAQPQLQREIDLLIASHHHNQLGQSEHLWDYINLIIQDPDFMRYYWSDEQLYQKYQEFFLRGPMLDFPTFKNVLDDFILRYFMKFPKLIWKGPIKINLGEKDPLILPEHESLIWRKIFPQAEINMIPNAGHYSHLEKYLR